MEIAVVILALLAAVVFLGWLRAQRSAGLAREQADDLRREHAAAFGKAEVDLATARTTLEERERELSAKSEEHEQARASLRLAQTASETAAAELAKAKAELGERSTALGTVTNERNEARELHDQTRRELAATKAELAEVRADHEARQQEIDKAREELDKRFKGIAVEVAKASNEEFHKQAAAQFEQQAELANAELEKREQAVGNLVKPVGETLEKLQKRVGEIEKARENAYGKVEELIGTTRVQLGELRDTTSGLRNALSSPQQRGRWGELTLERVLETAGMREHVDYSRQAQAATEEGAVRPDAVIRLPRGLTVPVDAKTPLEAYLRSHETDNEAEQRDALHQHASSLMNHARSLSAKNYAEAIDGKSPEFVVLFVPTETILDAAMHAQPSIWEDAWSQHRVLIASPGLLIALLRTVGVAWQQEDIQRNAQEIADASGELYNRLAVYTEHVDSVGKLLGRAVRAYNDSVGSFQSRVLVQARKMEELGAVDEARRIADPDPIETEVRELQAPELSEGSE